MLRSGRQSSGGSLWVTAAVVFGAGCAEYRPMPVTDEAVAAALAPLPRDELRKAAADLKHPALPPVEIPPDGTLSPNAAAVVAVMQNPALRASRDRRGVAAAQLVQAGILPNPQLAAALDVPAFGSTQDTVNGYSVGVNWDVTSLIGLDAAKAAARHEVEVADLEIAWQEWQVAMGAKLHATRVGWLRNQVNLAVRQVGEAEEVEREASEGAAAGLVTTVDRDGAAALVQKRRAALLAAQASLRSETGQLRQAIGVPAGAEVAVTEARDDAPATAPNSDELNRMIGESRLDLAALRAGYLAEEEKLRGAVLSQFPRIGLGITAARDTTNVGTIGFGITLDLPIFDRAQGRIAIETATRQQLFDELAARTFDARAEAARAYDELDAITSQIAEAERTAERLSRLVSALEAARRERLVDIVQLNQSRADLAEASAEALKLRQERAELRIAVEVATGRLLGGTEK